MRVHAVVLSFLGFSLMVAMGAETQDSEPTHAKELTQSAKANKRLEITDRARKAKMSAEELAWEKVLEQNLGNFYLPRYKQDKLKGKVTCWDHVKDEPGLPRVLLIGDSVSRAYTLPTRTALKGIANLHRAPANCGPTTLGLQKLSVWLGKGKWDLIHFNFGIHDRKTKPNDYAKRLEQITVRLKKNGCKIDLGQFDPSVRDIQLQTRDDVFQKQNCCEDYEKIWYPDQ